MGPPVIARMQGLEVALLTLHDCLGVTGLLLTKPLKLQGQLLRIRKTQFPS